MRKLDGLGTPFSSGHGCNSPERRSSPLHLQYYQSGVLMLLHAFGEEQNLRVAGASIEALLPFSPTVGG